MRRRSFVAGLAACVPASLFAGRAAGRLDRLGLQLWPFGEDLRKDLPGTLRQIAAIGYRELELVAWAEYYARPATLAAALRDAGLRAVSTHVSSGALLVGWRRHLDAARGLGLESVVCASLDGDAAASLDDWREWADRFNEAGRVAREAGLWLAFHSEPESFTPLEGRVPFDVLAERTDPALVRFQLDTGNISAAGQDPLAAVRRFGARCGSFHLKDWSASRGRGVAVGDGTVPWRELLAQVPDPDQKRFFVEFDEQLDALALATRSFSYLKALSFERRA